MNKIVTKYCDEDNVMLYDLLTNKFYRGAKLWRWTTSWRQAAVMPVCCWESHLACHPLKSLVESRLKDLVFVTLNDIPENKLESWW